MFRCMRNRPYHRACQNFIPDLRLMSLLLLLKARNEPLFWFGLANVALALLFVVLSFRSQLTVAGVNAWYKPLKFALSIGVLSWTVGWYSGYLAPRGDLAWVNWIIILSLGFEIIYIGWQAARGQMSHFNLSTPLYAGLYALMAIAATAATLAVAYLGWRFFTEDFPTLPLHYLWAIRLGIVLFVVFSLEGFVMGSRLNHSIGGPDGGPGLSFLGWSTQYGDPRVAHFVGMHALQVLPLLSYYWLQSVRGTVILSVGYALLAVWVLAVALQGKPLLGG